MVKFLWSLIGSLLFRPKPFRMAGTNRSFQYQVWLVTLRGRLGMRLLSLYPVTWRIRVEPRHIRGRPILAKKLYALLTRDDGWTQPGDNYQIRFSKVVVDDEGYRLAMCQAIRALTDGVWRIRYNPELPDVKTIIAELLAGVDITPATSTGNEEEAETGDSVMN